MPANNKINKIQTKTNKKRFVPGVAIVPNRRPNLISNYTIKGQIKGKNKVSQIENKAEERLYKDQRCSIQVTKVDCFDKRVLSESISRHPQTEEEVQGHTVTLTGEDGEQQI